MKSRNTLRFIILCSVIILFVKSPVNAQRQKLSISLSHPVIIGDTFFSDYRGLAGLNIDYAYPINNNFSVGGELGYSRSKLAVQVIFLEQSNNFTPPAVTSATTFTKYSNFFRGQLFISPSINLDERLFLVPKLGLGYATLNSKGEHFQERSVNGINSSFSLSLELLLTERLEMGIFSNYEFTHLGKPDDMANSAYNRNLHIINLGAKLSYTLNSDG